MMTLNFIAEFCQNHNGDTVLLQEMIHQAAEAGAAYGKIQTIFADDLSRRERFEEGLVEDGITKVIKRPYEPEYERLKRLEISYEEQERFVHNCKKFGLKPLTTCFTRGQVSRVALMGFDEIKVASYDCASLPLIRDLSSKFERVLISTGATYDTEIEATAEFLKENQIDYVFLHCVTLYPTPLSMMHLARLAYLSSVCPVVGFSNHAHAKRDGIKADVAAIHLGATYIERHFTVLRAEETRDGIVSIDASQLKEIIDFSKLGSEDQKAYIDSNVPEFSLMIGESKRALTHDELLNRDYYRGRFATKHHGKTIYNWQEEVLDV